MQARTTVPRTHFTLLLWLLAALGVALLALGPLALLNNRSDAPVSGVPGAQAAGRIAYLEFGIDTDVLWVADAADPRKRRELAKLPHALEFGTVPSLAPDRRSFVYAALPPAERAPTPETPADLWLVRVESKARPRLLSRDVDLRVPAVWSADGSHLVVRRSAGGHYSLVLVSTGNGYERGLVSSAEVALFPVAFVPDAAAFYYVRYSREGSMLSAIDLTAGTDREVARLSDGLTRDWRLAPSGQRLAYLALNLEDGNVASQAKVLDLTTGTVSTIDREENAFNPVWSAQGELALGGIRESTNIAGGIARYTMDGDSPIHLEDGDKFKGPATGFDVPLAFAPDGAWVAVRSFEGSTSLTPGASRLEVVGLDGIRKTIAVGEVTFIGWTH